MANTKISNLNALGAAPATNDLLVLVDVDASETKKLTVLNLIAAIEGRANAFTAAQTVTVNALAGVGLVSTDGSSISYRMRGAANSADMVWVVASAKWILRGDPANTSTGGGDEIITADATTKHVSIGMTTDVGMLGVDGEVAVKDGMTAPTATSGYAKIYVDGADGDLKVIFGNGFVATLAADS